MVFVNFVEQSKIETYHKTLSLLQEDNFVVLFFWEMDSIPREGHMVMHHGKIYVVTHTFTALRRRGNKEFTNLQTHMAAIVPMPEHF